MDPGFRLEYAKSSRAECKRCGRLIMQDTLRVGVESKSSYHDGFDVSWVHFNCCYSLTWDKCQGVEMLRWDDQEDVRAACSEPFPKHLNKKTVKANLEKLWAMKDDVVDNLKTKDMVTLVEANGYVVKKKNPQRLSHQVGDGLLNGMLGPCPSCKKQAVLVFNGAEYVCRGWATAYVRCNWTGSGKEKGMEVERFKFKIPPALKKSNKWLASLKFPKTYPTKSIGSGDDDDSAADDDEDDDSEALAKPEDEIPKGEELYGITIILAGNKAALGDTIGNLTSLIEEHGGEVTNDPKEATVGISSESMCAAKKKSKKLAGAIKCVPIVSVDWLHALTDRKQGGLALRADAKKIEKFHLAGDLDGPLFARRYDVERIAKQSAREKAAAEKEANEEAERAKKRKRGEPKPDSEVLRVDPKTGHSSSGAIHVTYDDLYGYTPYNVALNFTDLQTGVNKFYKMQIVKDGKRFYFWIHYGRVGVAHIGDSKIYTKGEKGAIEAFEEKFVKFTGNEWADRDRFEKKPGKYYMVELDDGLDDDDDNDGDDGRRKAKRARTTGPDDMAVDKKKVELDATVRNLVELIFDKSMMQRTLKAQDVDLKKMPLGKLSKRQMKQAYAVLSKIEAELKKSKVSRAELADLTTQFYTLIPHDFGEQAPALIDDSETVAKKQKLMEALIDIGIATEAAEAAEGASDPVVAQYESLGCDLKTIDKKSATFKMMERYVSNQKGRWTKHKIEAAFEVARGDQVPTYNKTKAKLGNAMLLWHGSGLANYVGILSQGLRIAPPEAPVSGYRLGKGVYLADLYEKSAGYCRGGWGEKYILIMLCEAALGKQYETLRDHYMEKPQKGSDSTKALGSIAPKKTEKHGDVTVPSGKPEQSGHNGSFHHNEYVVYDKKQVYIRYLLKVKM